jgi:hypothetical protein
MSNFDTGYVRVESVYRAEQIREGIVGRRQRGKLRRSRSHRRGIGLGTHLSEGSAFEGL